MHPRGRLAPEPKTNASYTTGQAVFEFCLFGLSYLASLRGPRIVLQEEQALRQLEAAKKWHMESAEDAVSDRDWRSPRSVSSWEDWTELAGGWKRFFCELLFLAKPSERGHSNEYKACLEGIGFVSNWVLISVALLCNLFWFVYFLTPRP